MPPLNGLFAAAFCATTLSATSVLAEVNLSQYRTEYRAGARYLVVEALDDDLIHFEVAASGQPNLNEPLYTTPMVAKTDYAGPSSYATFQSGIETAALRVTVDIKLCVTVYDKQQQRDLHTICPTNLEAAWKGLRVDSPGSINAYGLGQYFSEENPDGDWIGRVWDPLSDGYGSRLRGFAGGANNYSMFPILYALGAGTQGYALFVDQIYKQMWDFRGSPWQIGMWGDQIRWYVLSGPDLPDLRRDYMELTGKAPVPPKRSFGLWVSEFGFSNWDEVKAELADLRAKHFPLDGFAMDLQWFGGTFGDPDHSRMGSLTWDDRNFPDYRREIARLAADGVNLMLIEEPYIADTVSEYQMLGSRGFLAKDCAGCGPTYLNDNPWWGRGGMVDFTNPAGSDYWHDLRRQALIDMGITDHWADLGEPEQFNAHAWYYGFPALGKHGHGDIHNIYGFKWMASIQRGYVRHQVAKRPFLLSRTGTSGIQRFGAGIWSGDIGTNWGNLKSQMNVQMHMSMSGIDYYGSDTGGFQPQAINDNSERLYTQWFAASAALDVPVRPHAWNLDKRRSTSPSKRGDMQSNRAALRLRYALSPYYYALAHVAHRTGDPVFPPLVHYFQSDVNVRSLGSEKLIGRDLLVALVADAPATTRDVYLPAGRWFDFHSLETYDSRGQTYRDLPLFNAGVFRLPLFARAGAIIPMAVIDEQTKNIRGQRTDGQTNTDLLVKVFASEQASSFELTEDDGDSVAYLTGRLARTQLSQQQRGQQIQVTIGATAGAYDGMPTTRRYQLDLAVDAAEAVSATLNGTPVSFVNSAPGRVRIATPPLAATEVKEFLVALRAVPARVPSALFVCEHGETDPGVSVYAVGSSAALGLWDVSRGQAMTPGPYPTWTVQLPNLPPQAVIEWKCIKRRETGGPAVSWQPGANNVLRTGASGYAGVSRGAF